jgi:death-on-curing protein
VGLPFGGVRSPAQSRFAAPPVDACVGGAEYLSLEDLLTLARELGLGPVRDLGLLDAAAHRPATGLFGMDAYPDLDTKAAALMESVLRNHAHVDGNRRLAWLAVFVFFGINGVALEAPDDEAYDLVAAAAQGERDVAEVAAALAGWH